MAIQKNSLMLSEELGTQLQNGPFNGWDINHLRDELEGKRKGVDGSVRHLEEELKEEWIINKLMRQAASKHLSVLRNFIPSYMDGLKGICRRINELIDAEKRVQVAEQVEKVQQGILSELKSYRQQVLEPQLRVFRDLAEQADKDLDASKIHIEKGAKGQMNGSLLIKQTKVADKNLLNKINDSLVEDVKLDDILEQIRGGLIIHGSAESLENIIRSFNSGMPKEKMREILESITEVVTTAMRKSDPIAEGFDSRFLEDGEGANDVNRIAWEGEKRSQPATAYTDGYQANTLNLIISANEKITWNRETNLSDYQELEGIQKEAVTMLRLVFNIPIAEFKDIQEAYIAFIKADKGLSIDRNAASYELPFVPLIHVEDWQHLLETAVKLGVAQKKSVRKDEPLYSFQGRTTLPEMPLDKARVYLNLPENYQVRVELTYKCAFAVMVQYNGPNLIEYIDNPKTNLPDAIKRMIKELNGIAAPHSVDVIASQSVANTPQIF